jgi:hypothetical protein
MNWVNLTPHAITIVGVGAIEPSGSVARVEMAERVFGNVGGVPTVSRKAKSVIGLPHGELGTIYIVSSMVLDALGRRANRGDVLAPDTGETAIRNEKGQIVAVTRLVGVP